MSDTRAEIRGDGWRLHVTVWTEPLGSDFRVQAIVEWQDVPALGHVSCVAHSASVERALSEVRRMTVAVALPGPAAEDYQRAAAALAADADAEEAAQ